MPNHPISEADDPALRLDGPYEALQAASAGFLNARGGEVRLASDRALLSLGAPVAPQGAVVLANGDGPDVARAALETLRAAGAKGRLPIVARNREGFSGKDASALVALDANLLTPLQFFDWDFRGDQQDSSAEGAARARARLYESIDREGAALRAPQPFRRLTDPNAAPLRDTAADGADLAAELIQRLAGPATRSELIVVSGPAGAGKTVALNAVALAAHDAFNDAKRRTGVSAARPFYFEPDGLGSKKPEKVSELIDELMSTKLVKHARSSAFEWLLTAGYGLWIFDGLDEFYRGQTDFFPKLTEWLDAPSSKARVVIVTRDSLFSSSAALRAFLTDRRSRAPDATAFYELERWRTPDKRAFVERRLATKKGARGLDVDALIAGIEARPDLNELTDLPYYCALLVDAALEDRDVLTLDEPALLQFAVDGLFSREAGKLNIDWATFVGEDDLPDLRAAADAALAAGLTQDGRNPFAEVVTEYGQETLERMVGAAAHFYRYAVEDAHAGAEIDVADWSEAFEPGAAGLHLEQAEEERLSFALLQLAVFNRGADGRIGFAHELLGDFFAAKYALWMISEAPTAPRAWSGALGKRADVAETAFFRTLARWIGERPELAAAGAAAAAGDVLSGEEVARVRALLDAA